MTVDDPILKIRPARHGDDAPMRAVTSGFAAVDVIVNGSVHAAPGGTAVNVASALAHLGWDSSVVGTVGHDPAGLLLRDRLRHGGVDVDDLRLDDRWTTPIVLQERRRNDHVWRFSCPVCGARFAKHRPSDPSFAAEIGAGRPRPDVFHFDRVSLFTLALAKLWRSVGTLIVFEPAGLGRPALFDRAAAVADVIKFSSERSPAFLHHLSSTDAGLVETLGADGARFRPPGGDRWKHLPPRPIRDFVDSAGAGDWTTAGVIDVLAAEFKGTVDSASLTASVRRGQEFGAAACRWEGVRPEPPANVGSLFEPFGCPRVLAGEPQLV